MGKNPGKWYLSSTTYQALLRRPLGYLQDLNSPEELNVLPVRRFQRIVVKTQRQRFYFKFSFFFKDILWIVSKEEFQKGIKPMQVYWNNDTIQGNEALNVFWSISVLTGKSDCVIFLSDTIYLGRKETTRINYKTILKRFESQG